MMHSNAERPNAESMYSGAFKDCKRNTLKRLDVSCYAAVSGQISLTVPSFKNTLDSSEKVKKNTLL